VADLPYASPYKKEQLYAEDAYQRALRDIAYDEKGAGIDRANYERSYAARTASAGASHRARMAGISADKAGIAARQGTLKDLIAHLSKERSQFGNEYGYDPTGQIDAKNLKSKSMGQLQSHGAELESARDESAERGLGLRGLGGRKANLMSFLQSGERQRTKDEFTSGELQFEKQGIQYSGEQKELAARASSLSAAASAASAAYSSEMAEMSANRQNWMDTWAHEQTGFQYARDDALFGRNKTMTELEEGHVQWLIDNGLYGSPGTSGSDVGDGTSGQSAVDAVPDRYTSKWVGTSTPGHQLYY
jgi:hypothetical protein